VNEGRKLTPKDSSDPLPLGTFLLLRDLIRERLGVSFDEDKRDLLANKLADRKASMGLHSWVEYYFRLRYGPGADEEWTQVTDALSVQETYFWREMDQLASLVDVLLPQHVAAGRGPIRIWSAACATGEEPLTLAMALTEAGWFNRMDVEIRASDVSPAALEKASSGVYRSRSFRALPDALREKYFTPVEGGLRIDAALHGRVRFQRANLLEPAETCDLDTAHVILCRNVFIYFSQATIKRIVARFAERMPTPGHLYVGVSESLLRATTAFELEQIGEAFVYVKR
jgi:chemotaxis protein methyltransferase CheR